MLPSTVAVVGLGYVGLPLAVAFSNHVPTIGFDINGDRIAELVAGEDRNGELDSDALSSPRLKLTSEPAALSGVEYTVVSVSTPVDIDNQPDLSALRSATQIVGGALKRTWTDLSSPPKFLPVVVYESTVFPGCTEDICIPLLEKVSGLKLGSEFRVGYSPERVNPGDSSHSLSDLVKIVSAIDSETLEIIAATYGMVAKTGIYKAPNIRTAEAAKVLENVQRDVNIALINELAILCHSLGLETTEVLNAARTKWNFVNFTPGLVGGHCIPVDPYYFAHAAEIHGLHQEVSLAGRHVNDKMGSFVADSVAALLATEGIRATPIRALVLGVSYKENVRDTRNSGALRLIDELEARGMEVFAFDPVVGHAELTALGLKSISFEDNQESTAFGSNMSQGFDVIILAVPHMGILQIPISEWLTLLRREQGSSVVADIRSIWSRNDVERPGIYYWSL